MNKYLSIQSNTPRHHRGGVHFTGGTNLLEVAYVTPIMLARFMADAQLHLREIDNNTAQDRIEYSGAYVVPNSRLIAVAKNTKLPTSVAAKNALPAAKALLLKMQPTATRLDIATAVNKLDLDEQQPVTLGAVNAALKTAGLNTISLAELKEALHTPENISDAVQKAKATQPKSSKPSLTLVNKQLAAVDLPSINKAEFTAALKAL